jgi:hypothetical protein
MFKVCLYLHTLLFSWNSIADSNGIMGKVDQRKWSPSKMTKAIDAVRKKKMGWKKASKQFNVPKTTLMRLSNMKYGTPEEAGKSS